MLDIYLGMMYYPESMKSWQNLFLTHKKSKNMSYSTLTEVATYEVIQLCKELKGFIPYKIRMKGKSKDSVNVFKNENTYISLYIPQHILNSQKCLPAPALENYFD